MTKGMIVNICGIPHKVIECEDNFNVDTHLGQIDYKACEIRINKDMATEAKEETICHEMVHGILVHLGYAEQSQDETFVQALGNAIYQGFKIKLKSEEWTKEAEKRDMTSTECLESINLLNNKGKLSWLGKNCKDCGNEKCKKLGTLPKGHDCALWQPKENYSIKMVTNAKDAETYLISEDMSKNIEEINKLLFKNGQAESEEV